MTALDMPRITWSAALGLALFYPSAALAETPPSGQLFYNLDCTDFFWNSQISPGKAGDAIDRYIDVVADARVTVLLCNTNARRTNYRSHVWDAFWDGYDPSGKDDQAFLMPVPRQDVVEYRKGIRNMLAVYEQGIDYPDRVIRRCRSRGVSPWITLRMNDCHCNDVPDHAFHGSFWKTNPQLRRQNCTGYFATCLDYAHPEVRAFYMNLIDETLDRYDIDGLELDFMREPYPFSAGKEAEGAPILTEWVRQVRKKVDAAGSRRGHRIQLGVRVPSRPEVAHAMGLDAVAWAREQLIDLLVPTPRWETLEFDMPIVQWRELLRHSNVTLAGGLEVLYRPFPGCAPVTVAPEMAFGAAMSVLSQNADAVYLFNYFPVSFSPPVYQDTIRAMSSLDVLRERPRRFAVTYRDITAPGEPYRPPLPASGNSLAFNLRLGPRPDKQWICEVAVDIAATPNTTLRVPSAFVDGTRCIYLNESPVKDGQAQIVFRFSAAALASADPHEIKIVGNGQEHMTVRQLEVSFRPPDTITTRPATRPLPPPITPPGVRVLRNLEYIQAGHERNRLDLYLREDATDPMPVIVWIHGGGWQGGDKYPCPPSVVGFADKGFAVASINYRFSQHAVFPAQIQDCKAAIRWLRANAAKYNLDQNHIGVWGASAGGHLVALLGTTASIKDFEGRGGNEEQSSRVQAVVDWFGPSDLLTVGPKDTRTRLIGGDPRKNPDKAAKASPMTYISPEAAPFLIMHGDADQTVPISQSEILARALNREGVEAELITIKGGGHGGAMFNHPDNIHHIEEFFRSHLLARSSSRTAD